MGDSMLVAHASLAVAEPSFTIAGRSSESSQVSSLSRSPGTQAIRWRVRACLAAMGDMSATDGGSEPSAGKRPAEEEHEDAPPTKKSDCAADVPRVVAAGERCQLREWPTPLDRGRCGEERRAV